VSAIHVAHTWPMGWTVGFIGGDALSEIVPRPIRMEPVTPPTRCRWLHPPPLGAATGRRSGQRTNARIPAVTSREAGARTRPRRASQWCHAESRRGGPASRPRHTVAPHCPTGGRRHPPQPHPRPVELATAHVTVFRAPAPKEPTVQHIGHVCATCIADTGSSNAKPKLGRSRLNVWLAWALSVGGPLLWLANYPKVPDKESPWMADRHATV